MGGEWAGLQDPSEWKDFVSLSLSIAPPPPPPSEDGGAPLHQEGVDGGEAPAGRAAGLCGADGPAEEGPHRCVSYVHDHHYYY